MPFETLGSAPRRIAVIGGGISGMAAAHLLAPDNAVVLFEAEARLGGHARTVLAGKRGDQPVDTGFIVYNRVNYPHLVALFAALGVPVVQSTMTFGASVAGGKLEYGLRSLGALFAQRWRIADPRFLGMLRDIMRFNARAEAAAQTPGLTVGALLAGLRTGAWFRDYYILPLSGAIWSTPSQGILNFPAQALIRFMKNHALLSISGQHQWHTVKGGSVEYVRRLQAALTQQGVDLRLGAMVTGVQRVGNGALVRCTGGEWEPFDEVVFASHSDDALRLLADPSPVEARLLGAVRYQPNEAVLHADTSLMPKHKSVWSSWVYTEPAGPHPDRIDLTSLYDVDHGGAPRHGTGVQWVRDVLASHGLPGADQILLLAQPRVLGHVFNPISFWLCHDAQGALRVVIAEVSNTFGDRHSYLCHRADLGQITREDTLTATKIFHVSPFQPVEGGYKFRFDIGADKIGIWIDYSTADGGLYATLTGPRVALTNRAILMACLRRPFGSRRVLALIHWQAVKLALKGAKFRRRPKPPLDEIS